jgi:hypothetical protein
MVLVSDSMRLCHWQLLTVLHNGGYKLQSVSFVMQECGVNKQCKCIACHLYGDKTGNAGQTGTRNSAVLQLIVPCGLVQ